MKVLNSLKSCTNQCCTDDKHRFALNPFPSPCAVQTPCSATVVASTRIYQFRIIFFKSQLQHLAANNALENDTCCNSLNFASDSSKTFVSFPLRNLNKRILRSRAIVAMSLPFGENEMPVAEVLH